MRWIRTDRLKTDPLLAGLFPIKPSDREAIAVSMRERGFDQAEPIVTWKDHAVVVDGHTRLEAAGAADLEKVYVDERTFEDLRTALEYAIRRQRDRRNLTPQDLAGFQARAVEALDKVQVQGAGQERAADGQFGPIASREAIGKSAATTAELVGASRATVERTRAVLASDDEQAKASLRAGQATANGAYRTVKTAETARRDSVAPIQLIVPAASAPIRAAYSVPDWEALSPAERTTIIHEAPLTEAGLKAHFNEVNEHIDWARWSWNPVTGCLHDCKYCYARDIAVRYYDQGFEPTFLPSRLAAPSQTRIPDRIWKRLILPKAEHPGPCHEASDEQMWELAQWINVFVCSMADLFGKWVPQEWIDAVFAQIRANPQWNFLCLTKFPRRLAELEWPDNAWCGTSVDYQWRVAAAEQAFGSVTAGVKWLSCEPMMERLTFSSLEMFDWVVIGASSRSTQTPEFQPPWEWVEHLIRQARDAGCKVYVKPNLKSRPKEFPNQPTVPGRAVATLP